MIRKEIRINKLLHCDICPFVSFCNTLCSDMSKILKERGMDDAIRNEIPHDPIWLDNIDSARGLYHPDPDDEPSERFKRSRAIIMVFLMDFIYNRMSEKQREVLNLYFLNEMTQQNISSLNTVSQPAINFRKKLALKKIRKYFAKFGLET